MNSRTYKGGLKRLEPSLYEGISYVHWTMSLKNQATGWLNDRHHAALKAICQHALAREFMCCPAYCLMPDHGHFLFLGYDGRTNQRSAVRWMRREWNELLSPLILQHQPFDHLLREKDRSRDAFADVAGYILRNAERAGWSRIGENGPMQVRCFPDTQS